VIYFARVRDETKRYPVFTSRLAYIKRYYYYNSDIIIMIIYAAHAMIIIDPIYIILLYVRVA
jgi:hypothetical protein